MVEFQSNQDRGAKPGELLALSVFDLRRSWLCQTVCVCVCADGVAQIFSGTRETLCLVCARSPLASPSSEVLQGGCCKDGAVYF